MLISWTYSLLLYFSFSLECVRDKLRCFFNGRPLLNSPYRFVTFIISFARNPVVLLKAKQKSECWVECCCCVPVVQVCCQFEKTVLGSQLSSFQYSVVNCDYSSPFRNYLKLSNVKTTKRIFLVWKSFRKRKQTKFSKK